VCPQHLAEQMAQQADVVAQRLVDPGGHELGLRSHHA
jgi:hypothetical protein